VKKNLLLIFIADMVFLKRTIAKEFTAMDIKVIIEKDEDGYFVATVPALPGCISQGKTEKQALKHIKEAIELHVHSLAEDGLPLNGNKTARETLVSVAL
jgi:predicted RNase H-like HicB family nuclease